MSGDHSARNLLAATFLVAALLLAINRVVQGAARLDWGLPVILFVLGLAFVAANWYEARMAQRAAQDAPSSAAPAGVRAWDDLTRIEGIGPKRSAALIAAGISTFEQLANATEHELRAALDAADLPFAPSMRTWAEQAAYAARADWDGLEALQKRLVAGRRA